MRTNKINRDDKEVDNLLNKCADQENEGGSKYPGMTYEQGIQAGINWLIGNSEDNPLE